jgi:phospholipid/cholesterol/gamma-HCH transport system substrate-binding protein
MKKLLAIGALVAAVVLVFFLLSGDDSDDGYRVRAIFDNGGYLVNDEEVRIAGANVGTIEEVDVTLPGEPVAWDENGNPIEKPGKAIVVLNITDPGFQDFREDASCQIRPQSLIGEKFVDCRPTRPRAPGSEPAPPLKQIEDGPGEGQHLLPLGNSGTSVDPDLINNIYKLPYAQRFRLIFNELGAGLAGRGEDLEELVKRANPVLRDVDRLLGILSAQRQQLTQLAADSDAILEPLARERRAVAGFLANSGAAAEASAERGPELEKALQKFPTFLREFRLTMRDLGTFSDAGTPLFEDFGTAAPALTDATRTLTPFSEALTVSLKSLGEAGEASGPIFAEADPVVRKARDLAKTGVEPTQNLAKLFVDLKKTGGWDGLTRLIYNSTGVLNGFDKYGHFGRNRVSLTVCLEYIIDPEGYSGCVSNFNGPNAPEAAETSSASIRRLLEERSAELNGGALAGTGPAIGVGQGDSTGSALDAEGEAGVAQSSKTEGTEPLLDYLLGP